MFKNAVRSVRIIKNTTTVQLGKLMDLSKIFIKEPFEKKTEEPLQLNRNHIRIVAGFSTGHCTLKKHLQEIG